MSTTTKAGPKIFGYLPNDAPPLWRTIILGFQHALTMFPATVVVALMIGFDVGAVLTISGVATITALILSRLLGKKFIPLYYGSSFSYIAAVTALTKAQFGVYGGDAVRLAQVGIVATGIVNILVGLLIRYVGKNALDKVLPPIVTGSVAMVIGLTLAGSALEMAKANWVVAVVTLLATIVFSVYLQGKGFMGLIPILLGALVGYLVSIPYGLVSMKTVSEAAWFQMPRFTLPAFTDPRAWEAVAAIAIIAIATIPESTAHLYQISLYVDKLADGLGKPRYFLDKLIGLNLVLDGIGDTINGMFGGSAGTNYGENNSLMVITRNYSGPSLIAAGVIAILLGFIGKLAGLVNSIPLAVTGGLAVYLFGTIAMQGIALIQDKKCNLFDPRQLAIGAVIIMVGLGGQMLGGGNIPVIIPGIFPNGLPSIATGAVAGILLNVIFLIFKAPDTGREAA